MFRAKCKHSYSTPYTYALRVIGSYVIFYIHTDPTIFCYLCQTMVKDDLWNEYDHRPKCREENMARLNNVPEPHDVSCPRCKERLKMVPRASEAKHQRLTVSTDSTEHWKSISCSIVCRLGPV